MGLIFWLCFYHFWNLKFWSISTPKAVWAWWSLPIRHASVIRYPPKSPKHWSCSLFLCCWLAWIVFEKLMVFMQFGMEAWFATLLDHPQGQKADPQDDPQKDPNPLCSKSMPRWFTTSKIRILIPKVIWWRISTPLEVINDDTFNIGSLHDQNPCALGT